VHVWCVEGMCAAIHSLVLVSSTAGWDCLLGGLWAGNISRRCVDRWLGGVRVRGNAGRLLFW